MMETMPETIRPGTLLGRYRLLALIARGGMGAVWRAEDEGLGREVALKVLPEHLASDEAARRRFEREARVTASIVHPNVVTIFDVGFGDPGTGQELPFLVMELLVGQSLFDLLQEGPLPPSRAVRLAAQIARALGSAHDRGIVHRDLKPSNIMVLDGDHVKVLDFGLARLLQTGECRETTLTTPGMVLGSCPYMSPEQALGETLTPASDVFALGAVIQEMLTGERVFKGSNPVNVLEAVVKGQRRPVREMLPTFPASLEAVVERCLANDPAKRYENGHALAADLELVAPDELARGAGGETSPPTRPLPEAVSLARRRIRRRTLGLAAGVAFAGLVAGLLAGLHGREPRRPDPGRWKASRILTLPGLLRQPAWHPNGHEVAVNHMVGGHGEILVVDLDQGSWREVARSGSGEVFSWPRFSPDGSRLAVTVLTGSAERIEVYPAVGGPPMVRLHSAARAAWSSERSLILARYENGMPGLVLHDLEDGSERTLLEPSKNAGWWDARPASDGRLAVLGGAVDTRGGLWIMRPGQPPERWLEPGIRIYGFDWAPGGRSLIAVLEKRVVRIRKGRTDGILPALEGLADPAISPEGRRLAMVARRRRWEVVAFEPSTGERECVLCGRPGALWGTAGPDGSLVFGQEDVGGQTIFRRAPDGRITRILPAGEHGSSPVLDPTGRRVAYLALGKEGRHELRVADLEGGAPLTVAKGVEASELPSWSPDGTRLTWAAGSPLGVWVGPVGGGQPVRILKGDYPRWSPAGDWIAAVVWTEESDPDQGLWVVHPDGTGARKIGPVPSQFAWTPDGRALWQIRRKGEGIELWRCAVKSWRWRRVRALDPGGPVFAYQEFLPFSVEPGTGRLLLNLRRDTGELVLFDSLEPSRW